MLRKMSWSVGTIFAVVFGGMGALGILIGLIGLQANHKKADSVRQAMLVGEVVGFKYVPARGDSVKVMTGDPASGAAGGAVLGYFFFGPLGGLAGAALGAEDEANRFVTKANLTQEETLVLFVKSRRGKDFAIGVKDGKLDVIHGQHHQYYSGETAGLSLMTESLKMMILADSSKRTFIRIPIPESELSSSVFLDHQLVFLGDQKIRWIDY